MEKKNFKFEIKDVNQDEGTFEGIASAFRKTPDKVKDIITPGAFKKTVTENPMVPGLYMHDINQPVSTMSLTETPQGLWVKGQIVKGIQKAEETLLLMKAGVIKTMSIGYDAIQKEFKDGIRYLKEVKVYEVSVVVGDLAADDQAIITAVKTDENANETEENLQPESAALPIEEAATSTSDDEGAAKLAAALDGISAKLFGFDVKKAEDRLDAILSRLEK